MIDLRRLNESHRRFLAKHKAAVSTELHRSAQAGLAEVLRNPGFTPRTGALQRATDAKILRTRTRSIVRLRNAKPYAAPIDKGSRPHVIRARRGVLRFTSSSGALVYRRQVNHPGNKPYRFLERASSKAGESFGRGMAQRMTAIARQF
ncbi:MAG TPA: hypothetical protein VFR23_24720 [Jiangellaceae bacterium]|nr:hypothetical protein [Jiangellaceae bacterium]